MEWLTTSTILQRLGDFDDRAIWERFNTRFRSPLESFARRLGLSPAEADDAAQEALLQFAEAYRAGKYVRQAGRLSSWLFGIAFNQVATLRRKRIRERQNLDPAGGHPSFWAEMPAES